MNITDLQKLATKFRISVLEMTNRAKFGYIGGSFSCMEILTALYFGYINGNAIINYDTGKPGSKDQDFFVLSKAHAAPAWYAVLAEVGFFPKEDLQYYGQVNALLSSFPNNKIPGVVVGNAMPGQGLSMAVGIALDLKAQRKKNKVYCLIGDGELQVGQIWQAAMTAAHKRLDNLCVIIDYNKLQAGGTVHKVMEVAPVQDKFESFGWKVLNMVDGHDIDELMDNIDRAWKTERMPTLIKAPTIKGKGVSFIEGNEHYHQGYLTDIPLKEAITHLEKQL